MIRVQGRRAPWVVEKAKLEMFWAEMALHPLKRNKTPLAGSNCKEERAER